MICKVCLEDKEATDFKLRNKSTCKSCIAKRMAEWYKKNSEKYKEYRRAYWQKLKVDPKHIEYRRAYFREYAKRNKDNPDYKKRKTEIYKRHRAKNLDRRNAYNHEYYAKHGSKATKQQTVSHYLVAKAIREGVLIRADRCECCREYIKTEGHHDDYSKPLVVRWLCRPCHRFQHLKAKID